MIKNVFKKIEEHCGSQKAAALWLHVAYSTYREWYRRGDSLSEKNKAYISLRAAEIEKKNGR